MRSLIASILAGLGLCAVSVQSEAVATANPAAPAGLPPASAFGSLPATRDVQISPDGKSLAWVDESGADPYMVMLDLATHSFKRRLKLDAATKFRSLQWADNDTVLVTVSVTVDLGAAVSHWNGRDVRHEYYRTIAVDLGGSAPRTLLMTEGERTNVTGADVVARRADKPKTVLMSTLDFRAADQPPSLGSRIVAKDPNANLSLFEVDTRTGKGSLFLDGTPATVGWVSDSNGRYIARAQADADGTETIQFRDGTDWRELYRGHLRPLEVSADGRSVLAIGVLPNTHRRLWAVPVDGSPPQVLLDGEDQDVTEVLFDTFTGAPLMGWLSGAESTVKWLDSTERARREVLSRSFGGRRIDSVRTSQDKMRAVVEVSGGPTPGVFYFVDFQSHRADIIGEEYPALANVTLGEIRTLSYKARDGLEIPAYLTLPPGREPKNLPLVVLPHGGPEARDLPEFDWWAQFLASRGYAVLQPQFRGSTGFGQAFREAGYHQWGGLMQDDVSDGVGAMVTKGIADPKRVCIVGASYGGYVALAGAAFTPDLYKCAASINGVSNLQEMLAWLMSKSGEGAAARAQVAYWREHIGTLSDAAMAAKSPAHAAEQVKIPILLLHAADDTVVPIQQSRGMEVALKQADKPVLFKELPGEDHWLSHSATRIRVLEELEKFLGANL